MQRRTQKLPNSIYNYKAILRLKKLAEINHRVKIQCLLTGICLQRRVMYTLSS